MSWSGSSDYFAQVHQVLNAHIRKGRTMAAMAILANPTVYEDARFWTSPCIDHGLIAGAVILDGISSSASSPETQLDDSGNVVDGLTPSDLRILLTRVGEDGSLVSGVLRALEQHMASSKKRHQSPILTLGTAPLTGNDVQEASTSSSPSDLGKLDLAQVAAALLLRSGDGSDNRPLSLVVETEPSANTSSSAVSLKRPRSQSSPGSGDADTAVAREEDDEGMDAVRVSDPLALPGSVRISKTLEEHDAMLRPMPDRPLPNAGSSGATSAKRPRRRAFSSEEDDAILQGIGRFPAVPGRFALIFSAYKDVWAEGRKAQHLFDHWRATLRDRALGGK